MVLLSCPPAATVALHTRELVCAGPGLLVYRHECALNANEQREACKRVINSQMGIFTLVNLQK